MKKIIIGFSVLLLSSLVLASCGPKEASSSPSVTTSSSLSQRMTAKDVEYYLSADKHAPLTLAFDATMPDIPFISMRELKDLIVEAGVDATGSSFTLSLSDQSGVITLTRDNGSTAVFDFPKKTLTFSCYEAFVAGPYAVTPLDPVSVNSFDSDGNPLYITREKDGSSWKAQSTTTVVDLGHYQIPLVYEGGEGYFPVQTFSDFIFSAIGGTLAYNGQALFLAQGSFNPIRDLYYAPGIRKRSSALANFTYHELCLSLDVFYGLKSEHGITEFDSYFETNGYKASLLSEDGAVADSALKQFINTYFEDFHSGFLGDSSYAGEEKAKGDIGTDMISQNASMKRFSSARMLTLGSNPDVYQEIGDTAFVTFDQFTALSGDYYAKPQSENMTVHDDQLNPADTFAVVEYAHSQIMKTDSIIKNVVIDLSCNGGGALDSLSYVAGWLQNYDVLDVRSSINGMRAENYYSVDVNLDKTFDPKDNISQLRLFCLVSPASFSCGNYLPSMLKIRQKATILGQTSGGGGCMVKSLGTADGSLYQISGNLVMTVAKNGSFLDIDSGVDPDYRIADPKAFYDRSAIAKAIDSGAYGAIH